MATILDTNFSELLANIENGNLAANELRKVAFQKKFSLYIKDAGNIALAIERRETPAEHEQQVLHSIGNVVLRFYELDADALREAFLVANYTAVQCDEIAQVCKGTVASLKKTAIVTFDCQKNNKSLMQEPRTRSLVHSSNKNKTPSESIQRAFIQYLQHEGLPNEILERMARLSLYNQYHLADDIAKNIHLKNLYETFRESGQLTTPQIIEATKLMEMLQLNRLKEFRVVLERDTENGLDIARSKRVTRTNISTLYKAANARELDAYTVHEKCLIAACVTTHTDLEQNALSGLTFLRAAHHSFLKDAALLKDINDATVQVYCNSEPAARRDLNSALAHLKNKSILGPAQEKNFIELPLHQEILKFMVNSATPEYSLYSDKITFGVYGSNQSNMQLDPSVTIQIQRSVQAIADAANILEKVIVENPRLQNILGAVEKLGTQLSDSYTYAMELRQRHNLMMDTPMSENLNTIEDTLGNITRHLLAAGSRYTSNVRPRVIPEREVLKQHVELQRVFQNREDSLRQNKPTAYAQQKEKQYSLLGESAEKRATSNISALLNGTGPYVVVKNKALIRDALIERANRLESLLAGGTFSKASMTSMFKGIIRLNNPSMAQEVYLHVFQKTPLLKEHILNFQDVGAKSSPKAMLHTSMKSLRMQEARRSQKSAASALESPSLSM